jgi:tetratricopeptide (TPR) repeat protein
MRTWLDAPDIIDGPDGQPGGAFTPIVNQLHALLRSKHHLEALDQALHQLHQRMPDWLEARMLYVLARAALEAGESALGWTAMERAAELTPVRADRHALAQVLATRARARRNRTQFGRALTDYARALELLHEVAHRTAGANRGGSFSSADADLETEILIGQTIGHFMRGRHELCDALLERAYLLETPVGRPPHPRSEAGQILWMKAQSARWMGQPWRALELIDAALELLHGSGTLADSGRVFAVSAEIALDCVAAPDDLAAYRLRQNAVGLLARAERHARLTLDLCRQRGDRPGEHLARLAQVRHGRAVGLDENRLATLDGTIEFAVARGDVSLLVQAYTAVGDELAWQEQWLAAREVYELAEQVASHSEVPVMGHWARLALDRLAPDEP